MLNSLINGLVLLKSVTRDYLCISEAWINVTTLTLWFSAKPLWSDESNTCWFCRIWSKRRVNLLEMQTESQRLHKQTDGSSALPPGEITVMNQQRQLIIAFNKVRKNWSKLSLRCFCVLDVCCEQRTGVSRSQHLRRTDSGSNEPEVEAVWFPELPLERGPLGSDGLRDLQPRERPCAAGGEYQRDWDHESVLLLY